MSSGASAFGAWMKNLRDGTAATAAVEPLSSDDGKDEFVSRKLIRPPLLRENGRAANVADSRSSEPRPVLRQPKESAAEQTHAEVFYFQKQIQARTPVAVVLQNGEKLEGILDWYDRHAVRLTRRDHSNLLIYKAGIKYIHKNGEER